MRRVENEVESGNGNNNSYRIVYGINQQSK